MSKTTFTRFIDPSRVTPTGPDHVTGVQPTAFDVFYAEGNAGQTPANAVRLALADHIASHNLGRCCCGVPQFTSQLARAAAILDAFEKHRFTLDRVLQAVAGDATDADAAFDARQAFINAVA